MSIQFQPRPQASAFSATFLQEYAYLKNPAPQTNYRITVRHPGYRVDDDILFTLHAWDCQAGGLHHGFVHTICGIIADNRYDGYLSRSRSGRTGNPVTDVPLDAVLPAGTYWYYVLAEDDATQRPYQWPVVPTFQEYRFPDALPEIWQRCSSIHNESAAASSQSAAGSAVRARDIRCRVTGWADGTQVAHLVPDHERSWFLRNSMSRYNEENTLDSDNLLRDLKNLLLLRSDMHTHFDNRKFVFFPKTTGGYVTHVLQPTKEMLPLYHNTAVDIASCGIEFLFARFAWAIFPTISGFLSRPDRTRLVVCTDKGTGTRKVVESTSAVLSPLVSASRSSSPSKRSRTAASLGDRYGDDDRHQTKRRRLTCPQHGTPSLSFDDTPSPLEADGDMADSRVAREVALAKQRPIGYKRPPPYDKTRPAKEELQHLGFDILDDTVEGETDSETSLNDASLEPGMGDGHNHARSDLLLNTA